MNIRVWAPEAVSVEIVIGEKAEAMLAEEDGYWSFDVPAGAEYALRLDGNGPYPDPRSRWQPRGVHGASVAVDPGGFAWADAGFFPAPLSAAAIYELHVGTFSEAGTYAGAAEKLPYLRDLGVTHIELMPLATFPGHHGWGYDGVALYAPHPAYGEPADLQAFVQAAHDHGIAVLLDVVYNHLGPDGNYLGCFGPYFTEKYRTPWGAAVNFDDAGSDEVRAFFLDNARMWLDDYHFDGLRLDAVHAIHDTRAQHFLEELAEAVAALGDSRGRHLVLIAESDSNDPRLVWTVRRGGYALSAHWMDDFHHALHAWFTGERDGYYADFGAVEQVAKAWRQAYVFDGQHSGFRGRCHGRPPHDVAHDQLVVFSQNHDQIGNRAFGERLSHMLDVAALKAVAALTILSPFVPLLFQGEEWAATTPFLYFTDHQDPELARAVREGRQREFAAFDWAGRGPVPDPQDAQTFERSRLHWTEADEPAHAQMIAWYRSLLRIRREHPSAQEQPHVQLDAGLLVLRRGSVALIVNLGERVRRVPLPQGAWNVLAQSTPDARWDHVPPLAVLVAASAI